MMNLDSGSEALQVFYHKLEKLRITRCGANIRIKAKSTQRAVKRHKESINSLSKRIDLKKEDINGDAKNNRY
jgi:hypothetical protein